ncbi:MATE family efflux transporter [Photobacterium sp. 2_MG-2023]|uniref:MATE family efflux transporter n=1 Tax=Photobacterium sp. 2_MG-2023 TaxID=3062663 RepID=UPI0026E2A1E9|nr:MATE family efflux transporter [Photobacterium sp. 2_MG-2023]MDO6582549.1 MATE family efflux transporter [Photobacterium sp. 2_MG-2023]
MEAINQTESIGKTFRRFTIPAVMAMLVNGLYQIVDGVFVGHFLGQDGLSAINIAWPIISIFMGVGLMIGMGAGSLVSTFRGMRESAKARKALGNGLALVIFIGLGCSALLYVFGGQLMTLQGATGQILSYAVSYLQIFIGFSVIAVGASAAPFLIRNDDSPKVATGLMVAGAIINIVLDYIFIGILGWGLEGAAIATVTAQSVVVLLTLVYFCSRFSTLRLSLTDLKPDGKKMTDTLTLGSSCLVMYLYTGLMVAIHNRLFMEYGSAVSVAAYAIVGYLMTLYYLLAEGIAEGMQPPVSYFHGQNAHDKVRKTVLLACKATIIVGVSWITLLNLFPEFMISWFNSSNVTLVQEASHGITLHLFSLFLDGLIIIGSVYFMSVGQGGMALTISLSNMLVQLPFLWLLPKWFGENGVWLAMPVSNIFLAVLVLGAMWQSLSQAPIQQTRNTAAA